MLEEELTIRSLFTLVLAVFLAKWLGTREEGQLKRLSRSIFFFPVDFREALGSNKGRSSCSDGTSDWLRGHVKQL